MKINIDKFSLRKIFFQISTAGGFLAVVFFPVSVSLSQFGLFLAVAGWVLLTAHEHFSKNGNAEKDIWKMPFIFSGTLKAAFGIYAVIFISFMYRYFTEDNTSINNLFKSEFKDVLLISMALWTVAYASDERGRKRIHRWLIAALIILIVSGLVSIFSKYRLAKIPFHIIHGWEASAQARFQHHAGTMFSGTPFEVHLYIPIGIMNTHLTYAALLSFLLSGVFFWAIHRFITADSFRMKASSLMRMIPFILGGIILILNNGRSAIIGFIFSLIAGLYYYSRNYWKRRVLKFIYPSFFIFIILFLVVVLSPRLGERFEHLLDSLSGKSKVTDYQRYFLWQASLDVIYENPFIGTGPGNFRNAVDERILQYSVETPSLWYAYSVIQRGHAHNDVLHLQAIAGMGAVFFYLLFFYLLVYRLLRPDRPIQNSWFLWGVLVMLPAGLFQCYFQDDEVLLPFWILAGLVLSNEYSHKKGEGNIGETKEN